MNTRERYLAVLNFRPVDRTLKWADGFFAETIRRWYEEGLPKLRGIPNSLRSGSGVYGEDDHDVKAYFKLDPAGVSPSHPGFTDPFSIGDSPGLLCPAFEPRVLEDYGDWVVRRTAMGTIVRDRKDKMTLPYFISGPVKNRDDWERLKDERLQPRLEERFPENWDEITEPYKSKDRDYPVFVNVDVWRTISHLMGNMTLLRKALREPDLIRDMADTLADLWVKLLPKILKSLQADTVWIGEDMCYRNGPFISFKLYKELFFSAYRKIISISKENGAIVGLETDGDCRLLIPFFMEVGIDVILPFECTNGQNVVEIRRQYPRLAMIGGIDKKTLIKGRIAIDEELYSKIPFMLEHGGYIPTIDHNVPPEVSFKNYAYYRRRLNQMILNTVRK